VAKRKGQK